jgi:hypothetical protein
MDQVIYFYSFQYFLKHFQFMLAITVKFTVHITTLENWTELWYKTTANAR